MDEIWKDIKGYEGRYEVSNMGRVKSLNYRRSGKSGILKSEDNGNGYFAVNLRKDNKNWHISVHRLVALTFLPNYENFPEVNHKDEIKDNNNLNNLEWCTTSYNVNYGTHNQRSIETRAGYEPLKTKKSEDIPKDYTFDLLWYKKDDFINPLWFKDRDVKFILDDLNILITE